MARSSNPCPTGCSGGAHRNQHQVEASQLEAAGVTGEWITNAWRCGYCDMYYSTEPDGRKVRRGFFGGNTLMTAENWTPYVG